MDKNITKRQEDVLNYIKKYVVEHGFPPSTREIGAALGLSSPATVHTHLKKLEDAGCIRKTNSKFRTIEIVGDNEYAKKEEELVKVPYLEQYLVEIQLKLLKILMIGLHYLLV